MTIHTCGPRPVVEEFCTPECVRWARVNEGNAIRIYHDTTEYEPGIYPAVNDATPDAYLRAAVNLWNASYPCGALFTFVDDPQDAEILLRYTQDGGTASPLGTALCLCDEDNEVCQKQFTHEQAFSSPRNPSTETQQVVTMFLSPGHAASRISEAQWINVYVHELGHALGMGHVYGLDVLSRMGVTDDGGQIVQLYDFDLQELERRYPCDCTLTAPLNSPRPVVPPDNSSDHCPGCHWSSP